VRILLNNYFNYLTLKKYLCIGVRHGDVKEWNFCWDKYNQSHVPSERKLLLKVLGTSNDPWLLQR
jgi:hypothetical protein